MDDLTPTITFRKVPSDRPEWSSTKSEYDVIVDGEVVGRVRHWTQESWRSNGRYRTSMRGHAHYWEAVGGYPKHYTRAQAAEAVVKAAAVAS